MLGVMSAFVFAGQMVNFPVAGGTSGHLLGGVLAAVFLGPHAAAMVLATVLTVQCLFFQDGGITTLGANLFNLALVGVYVGYGVFRGCTRWLGERAGWVIGVVLGAWSSIVAASGVCALQLAASGTAPLRLVLPAMLITHAVIGLGEAAITLAVVSFVRRVRPDLIYRAAPAGALPARAIVLPGLAAALGVALLLSPFASSLPDGLEWVGAKLAFVERDHPPASAPFADYLLPGVKSPMLSNILAAAIGTFLCLGVAWGVARLVARWGRRTPRGNAAGITG